MDLERIRPTWAEIDLGAVKSNVEILKQMSRAPHLMAIVKANAYGHGARQVALAALEAGADWLGVATVEEGISLRRVGVTAPILVLGYVSPGQAEAVVNVDLRVALFDSVLGPALNQAALAAGRKARVHLKVDTGMGRIGVRNGELRALVRQLDDLPAVEVEGIFSHLAVADEPGNPYTQQQVDGFETALADLAAAGVRPSIRHIANSAALMLRPEVHYDLVRTGIAVLGLPPEPAVEWPVGLTPALSWKTRVGLVKQVAAGQSVSYGCTYTAQAAEQVATLPVGYADGYSRLLSNKGEVLIGGRRCPVIGRVTMDQMMVRLPTDLQVQVGDEVVLIGRQGDEEISAVDLAKRIGTISYEVICAISARVPRFYLPTDAG